MKKIIYILMFLFPAIAHAQQSGYKSAPLDYMWQNVGDAGFSTSPVTTTCLAVSPSGEPYVAFIDFTSMDASVMRFDGVSWLYVGNAGFAEGLGSIDFAFGPSGEPYVAFSANHQAFLMKYDGNSWVYVGDTILTGGATGSIKLTFSPADEPYVALDYGFYAYFSVQKYDGYNWVIVGDTIFPSRDYSNLAFSSTDEPLIAYRENVLKYNGTSWVNVGNAGLSEGEENSKRLAFSPSGEPYVAFADSSYEATVKKFDGTSWLYVGNAGFSEGGISFTDLAFGPSGEPYVAYKDWGNSSKATVMKFDGTDWVNVGNAGFSAGEVDYTSLAFNGSGGQPYVAYVDYANSQKATVMKYDFPTGFNELQHSPLSFYPNPASTTLTVVTTSTGSLLILNANGQSQLQQEITNPITTIDVSTLANGVYVVKVFGEKGVEVGKFIKQ